MNITEPLHERLQRTPMMGHPNTPAAVFTLLAQVITYESIEQPSATKYSIGAHSQR